MENKVSDNVMELDLSDITLLKPKKHIFISGSIGIGKTTLINNLKSQLEDKYGFIDELLGDELIELSYDNNVKPQRSIELNLQLKKFHQVIYNEYKGNKHLYIYDRGIIDPITFATIFHKCGENLDLKHELKYISNLIKYDLNHSLKERSYLILLDDKTANIWKRIESRNRDFEQNLPVWLIENFTKTYLKLASKFKFNNIYIVNVNGLTKEEASEKVKKLIGEIDAK